MVVYLGFVSQREEKPSYAIPNYYRDLAKQLTELDFDLVNGNMRLKQTNP